MVLLGDVTAPVRPVVLVGMMGSGKTTVGRRLAAELGRDFVDADEELEARTGRSVRTWFADEGETGFRRAEAELMAALLSEAEPRVVAAGGGAVVTPATRAALRSGALVVWLRAGLPFLVSRAGRRAHRPLLDEGVEDTLARLLEERTDFYAEVADIVVEVEPVRDRAQKPKREMARIIAARVRDAEARAAGSLS